MLVSDAYKLRGAKVPVAKKSKTEPSPVVGEQANPEEQPQAAAGAVAAVAGEKANPEVQIKTEPGAETAEQLQARELLAMMGANV